MTKLLILLTLLILSFGIVFSNESNIFEDYENLNAFGAKLGVINTQNNAPIILAGVGTGFIAILGLIAVGGFLYYKFSYQKKNL